MSHVKLMARIRLSSEVVKPKPRLLRVPGQVHQNYTVRRRQVETLTTSLKAGTGKSDSKNCST